MREQVRDKGRLEHILAEIDNAFMFTEGVTFEDFQTNKLLRYGVTKCVEIIGEASYKLTNEFRETYSDIEWKKVIGLRHVLVHGYYQLESIRIWQIIQNDLPPLKQKIQQIYDTYK
ncbi:DUF86 domain-containing protein [Bacteroidia bacterium]|nr:DUF86 domain-containing protein [Bacteroidia bacterium]